MVTHGDLGYPRSGFTLTDATWTSSAVSSSGSWSTSDLPSPGTFLPQHLLGSASLQDTYVLIQLHMLIISNKPQNVIDLKSCNPNYPNAPRYRAPVLQRPFPTTNPAEAHANMDQTFEANLSLSLTHSTISNWWFQPPWKILVSWDDYSQYIQK